ncbi:signal peptidase complex subunit 1-like [Actinia tenebrosa]|uniref:Signal peptidase complex subunit 1 n=1 Tax=Actinia tenebrosa TaxID=6105 RepID=A0A6P8HXE3_ACTTE|nr:signal peptidase complex subunit 1-like [Actinia tenebrosa]
MIMVFDKIRNLSTHMDFEGQKLAEKLFHIIILSFGIVGFVWGYCIQQFGATVIFLFAGFFVSCLVVLPPWPCFRRNPLVWQKPRPTKQPTDSKKDEKSGKKKQKAN